MCTVAHAYCSWPISMAMLKNIRGQCLFTHSGHHRWFSVYQFMRFGGDRSPLCRLSQNPSDHQAYWLWWTIDIVATPFSSHHLHDKRCNSHCWRSVFDQNDRWRWPFFAVDARSLLHFKLNRKLTMDSTERLVNVCSFRYEDSMMTMTFDNPLCLSVCFRRMREIGEAAFFWMNEWKTFALMKTGVAS